MLNAIDDLHQILNYMATVLTVVLALALGRGPERACALIVLFEALLDILLLSQFDRSTRWWMGQIKALLVLTAYGAAVWRWPDRWLILLAGLQGFAVLLRLSTWFDAALPLRVNSLLLNSVGWLMTIVLVSASVGGALKRHDIQRSARPHPS
jgi:hypothetical protein